MLVSEGGLEPPRLSAYAPQTYVSARSTTPTYIAAICHPCKGYYTTAALGCQLRNIALHSHTLLNNYTNKKGKYLYFAIGGRLQRIT